MRPDTAPIRDIPLRDVRADNLPIPGNEVPIRQDGDESSGNSAQPEVLAQLRGATKRYGTRVALDGIDLDVRRGEIFALLGPNGAGKTTAISLLLGLLRPDAGSARLFGIDPRERAARRRIGAMLQTAGVPDTLTVGELVALFRSYYPQPRTIADIVDLAGVGDLLKRRYGNLSGGQQRSVQFALAIAGRPDVLFLDEPTTGLDIGARETLWKTIRSLVREGCAIVLTTHYLEEAEALADRVAVIARGRIVAGGSVAEIQARVAQRRIRCVTALAPEAIAAWPEVLSAARAGERIEIVTDEAETVVRQLLFEDSGLRELEVRRAGLAEAFVEITREAA
ncbi:MAG TPA: ABC transporter ATP-binding protein [Rudaea sp.]